MFHGDKFNSCPSLVFKEPVEVRLARAREPQSSPTLLRVLAKDHFWYVRDFVASNRNTPIECLRALLEDSDFRVRNEAAKNIIERSHVGEQNISLNDTILASQIVSSICEAKTSPNLDLSHKKEEKNI